MFREVDWRNSQRLAKEIYVVGAGLSLAASGVFMTSNVPFSPHMFLGVGLFSVAGLLALGVVSTWMVTGGGDALRSLGRSIAAAFRLLGTPGGLATVIVIISPVLLAVVFAKNRDVANAITRARMYFSEPTGDLPYVLINAFPGVKFWRPIAIQFSPNDPTTAYVLERGGALYTIKQDGTGKTLVLDISDEVGVIDVENGALGFDLHPNFATAGMIGNSWCFIYYTSFKDGRQQNRLSRFDLSLPDPATRQASETSLLRLNRNPSGLHNGGSVEFGPDGFLYLGLGEATDPENWQRVDRTLFGGILRIDVNQNDPNVSHPIPRQPQDGESANYWIPNDNPLVGRPDTLEDFYAVGLRNPFRFSFDPENSQIWAGDVGSSEWEEVNVIEKGRNYQFPYIEGQSRTAEAKPQNVIGVEKPPVYFYRHTANDRSVIGGSVYRGSLYPELVGRYIFSDNYSGKIMELPATGESVDSVRLLARATQVAQRGITHLVSAPDGRFLMTTLGAGSEENGRVWSLVAADSPAAANAEREQEVVVQVSEDSTTELFNSLCARCHGPGGKADGPDSKEIGGRFPDYTSPEFHAKRTDEQLHDVIRDGGEKHGLSEKMQPFGDILADEEINFLVKRIRSLRAAESTSEFIEDPKPASNTN
jgi:glucose/arabinose dehydrogenase